MLLSYSIVSVISDNCALHRSFGSSLDGGWLWSLCRCAFSTFNCTDFSSGTYAVSRRPAKLADLTVVHFTVTAWKLVCKWQNGLHGEAVTKFHSQAATQKMSPLQHIDDMPSKQSNSPQKNEAERKSCGVPLPCRHTWCRWRHDDGKPFARHKSPQQNGETQVGKQSRFAVPCQHTWCRWKHADDKPLAHDKSPEINRSKQTEQGHIYLANKHGVCGNNFPIA